jgi:hypothetical protein
MTYQIGHVLKQTAAGREHSYTLTSTFQTVNRHGFGGAEGCGAHQVVWCAARALPEVVQREDRGGSFAADAGYLAGYLGDHDVFVAVIELMSVVEWRSAARARSIHHAKGRGL